jgi:hypothetical protein
MFTSKEIARAIVTPKHYAWSGHEGDVLRLDNEHVLRVCHGEFWRDNYSGSRLVRNPLLEYRRRLVHNLVNHCSGGSLQGTISWKDGTTCTAQGSLVHIAQSFQAGRESVSVMRVVKDGRTKSGSFSHDFAEKYRDFGVLLAEGAHDCIITGQKNGRVSIVFLELTSDIGPEIIPHLASLGAASRNEGLRMLAKLEVVEGLSRRNTLNQAFCWDDRQDWLKYEAGALFDEYQSMRSRTVDRAKAAVCSLESSPHRQSSALKAATTLISPTASSYFFQGVSAVVRLASYFKTFLPH